LRSYTSKKQKICIASYHTLLTDPVTPPRGRRWKVKDIKVKGKRRKEKKIGDRSLPANDLWRGRRERRGTRPGMEGNWRD